MVRFGGSYTRFQCCMHRRHSLHMQHAQPGLRQNCEGNGLIYSPILLWVMRDAFIWHQNRFRRSYQEVILREINRLYIFRIINAVAAGSYHREPSDYTQIAWFIPYMGKHAKFPVFVSQLMKVIGIYLSLLPPKTGKIASFTGKRPIVDT